MHQAIAPAAPTWTAPVQPAEHLRIRSRATGVLVMTGFGFAWTAAGLLAGGLPGWCWIALVSITTALVSHGLQSLRRHPPLAEPLPAALAARRARASRVLLLTSAIEGLAILVAVNVVANLGHPQWTAAAAMLVVGLHFLPLAVGFSYRPHLATGAALVAWALGYPSLFAAGAASCAGPLGAGLVLLASAMVAQRATSKGW